MKKVGVIAIAFIFVLSSFLFLNNKKSTYEVRLVPDEKLATGSANPTVKPDKNVQVAPSLTEPEPLKNKIIKLEQELKAKNYVARLNSKKLSEAESNEIFAKLRQLSELRKLQVEKTLAQIEQTVERLERKQ